MSERIELEAEVTDVHPKMKRLDDGSVVKWIEVKVRTNGFNPEHLQALARMQGATCKITMAPVQITMAGME